MLEIYTPEVETPKLAPLPQGGADVNALLSGVQMGVQKTMEEGLETSPYDDDDDDDEDEDDDEFDDGPFDEDGEFDDEDEDDDEKEDDDDYYDWDAADEEDSY